MVGFRMEEIAPCSYYDSWDHCEGQAQNYCHTSGLISNAKGTITEIYKAIEKYNDPSAIFYASTNGLLYYYLLTCGFGELTPSIVILVTLLTNVFSNCFTLCCNLSQDDADKILDTADKYEVEGDLSSYPKILKRFQNKFSDVQEKLNPFETRLAVAMASRVNDAKRTPISLLFNEPDLREPNLAKIIFDMAGLNEDIQLLESSKTQRHAFELGSHPRNAQLTINGVNPLFSFFDKLKNQRSEVEEYENKQGKYSRQNVVRNIYEHAGFLPVSKKA